MAPRLLNKGVAIVLDVAYVSSCLISPDGSWLASDISGRSISIIDMKSEVRRSIYTLKCTNMCGMAWSPDSKSLIAVTEPGRIIQITNNNAHSIVYKSRDSLFGCAFSPSGILAVGGNDCVVTLLDPSNNFSVIQKLTELTEDVLHLAFSPDGNLLAVGCLDGHTHIYGLTDGKWSQVHYISYHIEYLSSLCFSPSGRMLLATSGDDLASIWNVPSGTATWSSTPRATLVGHINVNDGAFLGDESLVITSGDRTVRTWSTLDGTEVEKFDCDEKVQSLAYHAASGTLALGFLGGHAEFWRFDPYIAPAPMAALPDHVCVRERLAAAQAQLVDIDAALERTDGLRQQMSREQELKRMLDDSASRSKSSDKKELKRLQTAEYFAKVRDFNARMERRDALLSMIRGCTRTLDSLTESLSASGLSNVRGDAFSKWLSDIGMSKLQTALSGIDGVSLTMLSVGDVMEYDVTFIDAAALLLSAYMAHYKLSDSTDFAPPRDSVLSWDHTQTANWIRTLGAPFSSLASAGWHGAALCSLSPPRITEAGKGELMVSDAVKFIGLVKAVRGARDGRKDAWVSRWSGSVPIDSQAP